jgi:hypothetical protein
VIVHEPRERLVDRVGEDQAVEGAEQRERHGGPELLEVLQLAQERDEAERGSHQTHGGSDAGEGSEHVLGALHRRSEAEGRGRGAALDLFGRISLEHERPELAQERVVRALADIERLRGAAAPRLGRASISSCRAPAASSSAVPTPSSATGGSTSPSSGRSVARSGRA